MRINALWRLEELEMTIHKFSDEQFQQIQSALNAAIGMSLRFDQSMIKTMSDASNMMDDVANEEGEFKPFSTYPEDREKLLSLSNKIEASDADSVIAARKGGAA
jgi:hypothetical protein